MAKTDNQKEVLENEVKVMSIVQDDVPTSPGPIEQPPIGPGEYKKMLENNTAILKREYEQLDYLVKLAKLRIEYKQLLEAQK